MENKQEVLASAIYLVLLLVITAVFVSVPVMLLWNSTVPELFGLPVITFWQSLRLTFLCSLLFKSQAPSK